MIADIFKALYFLKMCQIFDGSLPSQFERIQNFIYSETRNNPHGREFSMQNLMNFADLSKIYWVLKKCINVD